MRTIMSPQEVSHCWAHRRQDYAATSSRNLYFRGDTIYSYGSHFPIARHLENGAIAFTTGSYSMTTARHISLVRQAIPSFKTVIYVADPCMTASAFDRRRTELAVTAELESAAKRRSQRKREEDQAHALSIAESFNAYAEAIGSTERIDLAPIQSSDLAALRRVLSDRDKAEAERRRLAEEEAGRRLADSIAAWKRGDSGVSSYDIRNAPTALRLGTIVDASVYPDRIENIVVETSRGASIPVDDARRLWPVIQRVMAGERDYEVGMELGGYRLTKIRRDGSIVVGCHDIAFAEIERIAKALHLVPSEVPA